MGKIDELINELCPDGVEYKSLGDIGKMERGNGLMKSDFTEEGFPCIHYGQIHTFYDMATYNTKSFCSVNLAKKLRKAKYGDLLIATTSEDVEACCKATVWLGEGEVAFSGDSYKFSHSQNPKYISYLFKTEAFAKQKRVCATGAKVVRVSGNSMEKFKFQIPPLSIQQQIVEILDTFTDSISNLQEELALREKQMEYYCNNLVSEAKGEIKTLGEIGKMERGNGLMKSDFTEEGFPCIHYGQIHTIYNTAAYNTKSFCSEDLAKKLRKAKHGDLLIATTSENVEACCKATVWLGNGEVAFSGDSYKFSHSQNPKYIAYLFKTEAFAKQKRLSAAGAKVVRVSGNAMENFKFCFPSLSRQQEIVDILDTFESMIANIKEEIELRQKQYEYYREKILTFERKEA